MNKIEAEIVTASGLEKDENETYENFLHRVMQIINDLPGDEWEGLSNEAQEWFNDAAPAKDAGMDLPEFPVENGESNESAEELLEGLEEEGLVKSVGGSDEVTQVTDEPTTSAGVGEPEPKAAVPQRKKLSDELVITLVTIQNPKRAGSRSHKEYELYVDGMTVGEYIEIGGSRPGVRWDAKKGFVTLSDPE